MIEFVIGDHVGNMDSQGRQIFVRDKGVGRALLNKCVLEPTVCTVCVLIAHLETLCLCL